MRNSVVTVLMGVAAALCWAAPAAAQGQLARGIWVDRVALTGFPMSGVAWTNLAGKAALACSRPDLSDQEDPANVCVMAKALVYARTGDATYRLRVVDALLDIVNAGTYSGRALALARELPAYVIAADLIDLEHYDPVLDSNFRQTLAELRTTRTDEGPANLIECHEERPNNWGTHCGAARIAIAAYLGDAADLARAAQVFKGWLGDRTAYAGFKYGDLSWQCNPKAPVGINPAGCRIGSASVDGVLPDDERRAGSFAWPPPKENYVYEALQGALAQAVILQRAGYDPFNWSNKALLRAFRWLQDVDKYPAEGDDTWQPYVINAFYPEAQLPVVKPSQPGKNVGWTDWTHAIATAVATTTSATLKPKADGYVRGGTYAADNYGREPELNAKDSNSTNQSYDRHAFVRFALPSLSSVTSAVLKLYVSGLPNGTPVPVCAFGVASDAWSETTLTWKNQPAANAGPQSCQNVSGPGWVSLDVTAFVRGESAGDSGASFMVGDSSQANKMVVIDSREGGHPPTLVIK